MQKNKIDELFDSIEAGDCVNIEQQNSQHRHSDSDRIPDRPTNQSFHPFLCVIFGS